MLRIDDKQRIVSFSSNMEEIYLMIIRDYYDKRALLNVNEFSEYAYKYRMFYMPALEELNVMWGGDWDSFYEKLQELGIS